MIGKKKYLPTGSELEILHIIWQKGTATVREVHKALGSGRDIGYTTTLKTMQIMTEKGILGRDETNRSHIYTALVSRKNTENHFLDKMIEDLFDGSASRLVIGALNSKKLSDNEIKEIRSYLKQFESD